MQSPRVSLLKALLLTRDNMYIIFDTQNITYILLPPGKKLGVAAPSPPPTRPSAAPHGRAVRDLHSTSVVAIGRNPYVPPMLPLALVTAGSVVSHYSACRLS